MQKPGPYRVSNKTEDIILCLVDPISHRPGRPRVITTDNWYSSFELAEQLHQRNLFFLRTVRKNCRFVLRSLINQSLTRPVSSTIFAFQEHKTLLLYRVKRSKFVHILTIALQGDKISGHSRSKPEAILLYNSTKGAGDTVDHLKSISSVAIEVLDGGHS